MIHLSELWAPRWAVELDGRVFIMRPLSLGTFADLEGLGLSLQVIAASTGRLESAHQLFCAIAEIFDEAGRSDVLNRMRLDPIGVREFQMKIKASLEVEDSQPTAKSTRRQVNTPKKTDGSDNALNTEALLAFSRLSGIPLADVSRFSFAGFVKASDWAAKNPVKPATGGLLG